MVAIYLIGVPLTIQILREDFFKDGNQVKVEARLFFGEPIIRTYIYVLLAQAGKAVLSRNEKGGVLTIQNPVKGSVTEKDWAEIGFCMDDELPMYGLFEGQHRADMQSKKLDEGCTDVTSLFIPVQVHDLMVTDVDHVAAMNLYGNDSIDDNSSSIPKNTAVWLKRLDDAEKRVRMTLQKKGVSDTNLG
tara:strand:- start:293 stop:859 length:567 start_codon:yes stop_codon:yes gene_type:complete